MITQAYEIDEDVYVVHTNKRIFFIKVTDSYAIRSTAQKYLEVDEFIKSIRKTVEVIVG